MMHRQSFVNAMLNIAVGAFALAANAADMSYTPNGTPPYLWSDTTAWGGTLPSTSDVVTIADAGLLVHPLVLEATTAATVSKCWVDNAVLYVERGGSLTVKDSASFSLGISPGAIGVVTNYGTITTPSLDLGSYTRPAGGAKASMARFDNFGTINISTHFRMGVSNTPSFFYNHEGATFNKTGGGSYSFYQATTAGGDSTIINEGTMVCGAKTETWSGNSSAKSEVILRKSGTFDPGPYYKVGHTASTTRFYLQDNSRMSGATKYNVGAVNNAKGYFTLSNESAFATTKEVNLGVGSKALGSFFIANDSTATFGGACNFGSGATATGIVEAVDSATATFSGACNIGATANASGFLNVSDSATATFGDCYIGAGGFGTFGSLTFSGNSSGTFNGFCGVGAAQHSVGEMHLKDSACVTTRNQLYVCGNEGGCSTGLVTLAGSSILTNMSGALVIGCYSNTLGRVELRDNSRLFNSATFYLGHGNAKSSKGARGELSLRGTSSVESAGNYMFLGDFSGATGVIDMHDSSSLVVSNIFSLGRAVNATGIVTVADNAIIDASPTYLGWANDSSGYLTAEGNGRIYTDDIQMGNGARSFSYLKAAGNSVMVISNITVAVSTAAATGIVEIAEGAVISNDYITIGCNSTSSRGILKMSGGSLIQSGIRGDSVYLNQRRFSVSAWIRGWGKVAFANPQQQIVDYSTVGRSRPNGIVHYGQVIADGEGEERDLDFSRYGAMAYSNTQANPSGTNGWFAVNKGRLKLPRCLPRKTANYRCTGDCYDLDYSNALQTNRLANTFTTVFTGAELNNYVFSELYATDRSDIPAGLSAAVGVGNPISIWRIGLFNDGPAIDEPVSPSAFTSAKIHFRLPTDVLDDISYLYVYRHDGTAGGKWKIVGHTMPSKSWPVVPANVTAPSTENWNMGWFAIVGRKVPLGTAIHLK